MIALLWLACTLPGSNIVLSGQVLTGQNSGAGAPDILVNIRNAETNPHDEVTTDQDGMFEVKVPSNSVYHLALSGTDIVPTAFSGIVGQSNVAIPEDELFVRSTAEMELLRSEFESCPNVDESGGVVEGIVRFKLQNTDDESYLVAPLASVLAYTDQGVEFTACYLDDDGLSLEDGEETGQTGRFAIFGVPQGPTTVLFQQDIGGLSIENYGFVYMPENGLAPFYPAFVDLAG